MKREKRFDISENLYNIGLVSSILLLSLLLLSALFLVINFLFPNIPNFIPLLLQNVWLAVLIKINAGLYNLNSILSYLNTPLDLTIMFLDGMMILSLLLILYKNSKVLSIISIIIPFLSILVVIITTLAGRCGVMLSGILVSIVMLRGKQFSRLTAITGIFSNILLFLGDIFTASNSSELLAILITVGFILEIVWIFRISRKLIQLRKNYGSRK
jgi:hypothetical protein